MKNLKLFAHSLGCVCFWVRLKIDADYKPSLPIEMMEHSANFDREKKTMNKINSFQMIMKFYSYLHSRKGQILEC